MTRRRPELQRTNQKRVVSTAMRIQFCPEPREEYTWENCKERLRVSNQVWTAEPAEFSYCLRLRPGTQPERKVYR